MKILLLSAYDAQSHKRWRTGLVAQFPEYQWTVLSLAARFFSWRLRGNAYSWFMHGKLEKSHLITLVLVVVLGGATLWLQDPNFIMWKPTVVNWLFAAGFLGAQLFTSQSLLERTMSEHLQLPDSVWSRLNVAWILFFILSGIANIYVAFNFDEATWVNFKLFGLLGLTIVFIIGQSFYLSRHIIEPTEQNEERT